MPHRPAHHGAFGNDRFGILAERFARFFGTPHFILGQTAVVALWIGANVVAFGLHWDPYPFILLNLAFSTQAAYAAPLILLAQTRQADRDKLASDMLEEHREAVIRSTQQREEAVQIQTEKLHRLLEENTRLTAQVEKLTAEIHGQLLKS